MVKNARSIQRREESLSRDRIIEASIELLDSSGEGGLTFRILSERLATGPGAIYWHIANKSDLLTAACDAVVARTMEAREAGEQFHQGGVLDVDDPVLEGNVEVTGEDVHRLIGGKRVLAGVVVNEKNREARGSERREDERAPSGYVWRASAARAENPSHSRIFLPSAIDRPK